MITIESLRNYLGFKSELEVKVAEILNLKLKLEKAESTGYKGEIEVIDFESETVEIKTVESSRCSCCPDERHWYSFPKSYLFDENWVNEVKKKVEQRQLDNERKKQEEEVKRQEEREEKERKELERLKLKYDN